MAKPMAIKADGEVALPKTPKKPLTKVQKSNPAPSGGGMDRLAPIEAGPLKSSMGDMDKDPDKGERPYQDHEVEPMAHHVTKAMDILSHPHKAPAVLGHLKKKKTDAGKAVKSFGDLQKKIGADMDGDEY